MVLTLFAGCYGLTREINKIAETQDGEEGVKNNGLSRENGQGRILPSGKMNHQLIMQSCSHLYGSKIENIRSAIIFSMYSGTE